MTNDRRNIQLLAKAYSEAMRDNPKASHKELLDIAKTIYAKWEQAQ